MTLTKASNSVILANTITGAIIANNAIESRHLAASVNIASVAANIDVVQDNVVATQSNVNTVQSNLSTFANQQVSNLENVANSAFLFSGQKTFDFTPNTYFSGNVTIGSNIFIGDGALVVRNRYQAMGGKGLRLRVRQNTYAQIGIDDQYDANLFLRAGDNQTAAIDLQSNANSFFKNRVLIGTGTHIGGDANLQVVGGANITGFAYVNGVDVLANDLATYNQITSDFQANDWATYNAIVNNPVTLAGAVTISDDLTVEGNVSFLGQFSNVNATDLFVTDRIILLANGATGTATLDAGFIINRGDDDNVAFVYDESVDEFIIGYTAAPGANTTINMLDHANVRSQAFIATDVVIANGVNLLANDLATYNQVTADFQANDLVTWNAAKSNDHTTLLAAYANDIVTLATADSRILANVGILSDFNTSAKQNVRVAVNELRDNVIQLTANVSSGIVPYNNVNTSLASSNVFFIGSANPPNSAERILLWLDGINQVPDDGTNNNDYIFNSGNNTVQLTEATIPAGLTVRLQAWVVP